MSELEPVDLIRLLNLGADDTLIRSGSGSPETVVTGDPGDLFLRKDGAAGEGLYIKQTGVGTNTGWLKAGSLNPLILTDGVATTSVVGATSGALVAEGAGSGGTESVTLSKTGFVSGFVDADAGAAALVEMSGAGGFAIGHAYARNPQNASVVASAQGSFASGFASDADILATGIGSFAHGSSKASGAGSSTIYADSNGSHASGYAWSTAAFTADIRALGTGSFAHGYTFNGSILASSIGSHASGHNLRGEIKADAIAAHASGVVSANTPAKAWIESSSLGGLVHGYAKSIDTVQTASLSTNSTDGGSVAIGYAFASALATGNASVASDGGGFAQGFVYTDGGEAKLAATLPGSFAQGSLRVGSGSVGQIWASAVGSFAQGYVGTDGRIGAAFKGSHAQGYVTKGYIQAYANGALARGYVFGTTKGVIEGFITASGSASHASGYIWADTVDSHISASGEASFAFGYVKDQDIIADGEGSFALGYAKGGDIKALGGGSFAHGVAKAGDILANGPSSHASGYTKGLGTGTIEANHASFVHGFANAPIALGVARVGNDAGAASEFHGATIFGNAYAKVATSKAYVEARNAVAGTTGGFVSGLAYSGSSGVAEVITDLNGALAVGFAKATNTAKAYLEARDEGSAAHGYVSAESTGRAYILSANGGFAHGHVRSLGNSGTYVQATEAGSAAFGAVYAPAGTSGGIWAANKGAFAQGYVSQSGFSGRLIAGADGAHISGFAYNAYARAYGKGSFVHVYTSGDPAGWCYIQGDGAGSSCTGYAAGVTAATHLEANGAGSFAHGFVKNNNIYANGNGSHASGYAQGGDLLAYGAGSFAHGSAKAGDILAEKDGSVAFGYTKGLGTASVSTNNASFVHGCAHAKVAGAIAHVREKGTGAGTGSVYGQPIFGHAYAYAATSKAYVETRDTGNTYSQGLFGRATSYGPGVAEVTTQYGGFAVGNVQAAGSVGGKAAVNSVGVGAVAFGYVRHSGTGTGTAQVYSNYGFAWGYLRNTDAASVKATNIAAVAFGGCTKPAGANFVASGFGSLVHGYGVGNIYASGDGARATGYLGYTDAGTSITASGAGSFAHGDASAYSILAGTGGGAFAFGNADTADIEATASNAVQFGPGTNAVANSIQVGSGFQARAGGATGSAKQSITLAAAATAIAVTSSFVVVTGDAGTNTIATITGGFDGMRLVLLFVDGLVTITDTDAHTADTVDLNSAFTSIDDTILELIYDGTSWYEISRSAN